MQEITILSGKGGAGKTSLVANLAMLQENIIVADCDVDASDLHLVLNPSIKETTSFIGGKKATLDISRCSQCNKCMEVCRFDAIEKSSPSNGSFVKYRINPISCEGCGVCVWNCPEKAIQLENSVSGEWYISKAKTGGMVHAKLFAAQENSGKLVSVVRQQARKMAEENQVDIVLIDGPPGISCPVIASLTGAQKVVIVVEPSLSGIHDLLRVNELIEHFSIPAAIVINQWDINPSLTDKIEQQGKELNIPIIGKLEHNPKHIEAQIKGKSLVEYGDESIVEQLKDIWSNILSL